MVTFLFASFLVIALLALGLYYWQKTRQNFDPERLPPPPEPASLFSGSEAERAALLAEKAEEENLKRARLIERASHNDKGALLDAHVLNDAVFYSKVLDRLAANAESDSNLLALASYVTRSELPVNKSLAQAMIDSWMKAPNRGSTAKALHFAALADDAALYDRVVNEALQMRRDGQLTDVTAEELKALFDGEFWILSARTRSSGAGFVLKRTLAKARRELEAASVNSPSVREGKSPNEALPNGRASDTN